MQETKANKVLLQSPCSKTCRWQTCKQRRKGLANESRVFTSRLHLTEKSVRYTNTTPSSFIFFFFCLRKRTKSALRAGVHMTIQHAALLTLIGLQLCAYMQGIHSGFQLELCNVKVSGWLNLVKLESQSKTKIDEIEGTAP